jgi:hypothetical protein
VTRFRVLPWERLGQKRRAEAPAGDARPCEVFRLDAQADLATKKEVGDQAPYDVRAHVVFVSLKIAQRIMGCSRCPAALMRVGSVSRWLVRAATPRLNYGLNCHPSMGAPASPMGLSPLRLPWVLPLCASSLPPMGDLLRFGCSCIRVPLELR